VKELRSIGIQPDILLCRCDREIPQGERRKLALFCNVREERGDPGLDVASIYDVPLPIMRKGSTCEVLAGFRHHRRAGTRSHALEDVDGPHGGNPEGSVKIAIVGKYTGLKDAYKSLIEALVHGGIANNGSRSSSNGSSPRSSRRKIRRPISKACTASWCRAASASAARRARSSAATFAPAAQRAVFRHLLRHADGGDRGARAAWRHPQCQLDRIRPDQVSRSSA
jgi:CTP synthase (UTP-ammonia lyase)